MIAGAFVFQVFKERGGDGEGCSSGLIRPLNSILAQTLIYFGDSQFGRRALVPSSAPIIFFHYRVQLYMVIRRTYIVGVYSTILVLRLTG